MAEFNIFKEFNLLKIDIGGNNKTAVGNSNVDGVFLKTSARAVKGGKGLRNNLHSNKNKLLK